MQIHHQALGTLRTNCYVVQNGRQALIIDPGNDAEWVLASVAGLTVEAILLTHGHFDHIGSLAPVQAVTGAPIYIHRLEVPWLTDPILNRSGLRPKWCPVPLTGPGADHALEDGQRLTTSLGPVEVRHTPGHTPGSVCFVMGDVVFSGDTLFSRTVGRTDLPGGDLPALIEGIHRQLLTLPDTTRVLPGHGPETTIGVERQHNPYLNTAGWVRKS